MLETWEGSMKLKNTSATTRVQQGRYLQSAMEMNLGIKRLSWLFVCQSQQPSELLATPPLSKWSINEY